MVDPIGDDLLTGREYFFDHFTTPDAHFFGVAAAPLSAAHFKRMQERPSVKKLLAYENEVNERFAKTAWARCADTRRCREIIVNKGFDPCRHPRNKTEVVLLVFAPAEFKLAQRIQQSLGATDER
jgi:hypothetical protein